MINTLSLHDALPILDAFNILSLTFTNKAAKEMKERISKIVGSSEAKNLWMGTFHSVFARILRAEADKLGYPSNFTIYDSRSEEHTSELQSRENLVCRLLLEKKKR